MSNEKNTFIEYANNSKNVSLYTTVSILLIFIFMISPLKNYSLTSKIFKLIIIIILGYSLYKNTIINYAFYKKTNVNFLNDEWNNIKTNILCSSLYSFFIFILLFYIIKTFF